jgi:hypothetical protein
MEYKQKVDLYLRVIEVIRPLFIDNPNFWGGPFVVHANLEVLAKIELNLRDALLDNKKKIGKSSFMDWDEYLLTGFNEGHGEVVELFWQKVKEQNLPLQRVNKMAKILKRGRIKDEYEYDFVTDVIVPYMQEGMITAEEEVRLKDMLGKFELKQR